MWIHHIDESTYVELDTMQLTKKSENVISSSHQVTSELITKGGSIDLSRAACFVKNNSGALVPLVKPKGYSVRVCGQDETVYAGNEDQLEAWKDFYLPERMEMEVIGAIDDFPCDAFGLQLVLLLCEDGNIYAYEDEVLHLVAQSLRQLFEDGLIFPGIQSFKQGEYFEDCTEEEYNEMMELEEVREIKEMHKTICESLDLELLESLNELKNKKTKTENECMELTVYKPVLTLHEKQDFGLNADKRLYFHPVFPIRCRNPVSPFSNWTCPRHLTLSPQPPSTACPH